MPEAVVKAKEAVRSAASSAAATAHASPAKEREKIQVIPVAYVISFLFLRLRRLHPLVSKKIVTLFEIS
jgi:hypothetical protein